MGAYFTTPKWRPAVGEKGYAKTCLLFLLQGTLIIPNLSSVLNEEGQWKSPREFNPDNFLNDNGEFVKPEAFMPFSTGKSWVDGVNLVGLGK